MLFLYQLELGIPWFVLWILTRWGFLKVLCLLQSKVSWWEARYTVIWGNKENIHIEFHVKLLSVSAVWLDPKYPWFLFHIVVYLDDLFVSFCYYPLHLFSSRLKYECFPYCGRGVQKIVRTQRTGLNFCCETVYSMYDKAAETRNLKNMVAYTKSKDVQHQLVYRTYVEIL